METTLKTSKLVSGEDYIQSLRERDLRIFLFGETIEEPVDHPLIRPSINAVAKTYDLALSAPELASVISPFTGERISRFLHVCTSVEDLANQNKMQRKLGQLTGTCFQRCVGMDAFNSLYSTTYEIDERYGTQYHDRLKDFIKITHTYNYVIGGAMTDVKGDRSLAPHQQEDPDMFVRITKRTKEGIYVSGAKAHQTGCINSHWMVIMPTMRLTENDRDYAVIGAIPVDAEGITYIYGRQSCDSRSMEEGDIDVGNAQFGGQEAMVILENV
ncbi:MAG: 4-hydroxyphenylacetate 3-hydroxylase N-terminal domain-containing protein, partial [Bacteroidota bacterium]